MESCECRVLYPRQPPQCSICREFGHHAPACPLSGLCRRCRQPGRVARKCTQAWDPSVSVFSLASHGFCDESDLAMEHSSPSPSIVASVPVSAQSTPSSGPNESGHGMEDFPRSRPKVPAVSAPVSVPAVTVSAASATVTVSASLVTVPVSGILSVAPVTVTGSVSPAIFTAPSPATVTGSSAMVTATVPATVTAPVPTSSSGIVPTSQVSVTPSTASSDRDFLVIRILFRASRGPISGNA